MILETYPSVTSDFLKKQKNCFANPVGYNVSQGINGIFDELLNGVDSSEKFFPFLNDIIRIKAVQDFSPSQAISFIFLLKQAIREELKSKTEKKQLSEELSSFESQIDSIALLSFDIYMKCRERIYEIKVDEVRRMTFGLLQRANIVYEIEEESDLESATLLTQNKSSTLTKVLDKKG